MRALLAGSLAGLGHPRELRPMHIQRRLSPTEVRRFAELYPTLRDGEFLTACSDPIYARHWTSADPSSFAMAARRSAALASALPSPSRRRSP